MAEKRVSVRLAAVGGRQVRAELQAVGAINAAIESFVPAAERAAVAGQLFGEEGSIAMSRIDGAGSIVITSQLPVEAWHAVIDEPTFADAILDRIVHNAHRLTLDGPSMRKTRT